MRGLPVESAISPRRFVTRWVSRQKGLASLSQGLEVAPENPALSYFLADALLKLDRSKRDAARALLERTASAGPRPEYRVEDAYYAEMARARLSSLPEGASGAAP